MATMDVADKSGATQTIEKPLAPGRAAATASRPVVLANEDSALLTNMRGDTQTAAAGIGAPANAESASGDGTLVALLKRLRTLINDFNTQQGNSAEAEATGNGSLIAITKRVRTLANNIWTSLGQATDPASNTDGSIIAILKQCRTFLSNISTNSTGNTNISSWGGVTVDPLTSDPVPTTSAAIGTDADAAYAGSGAATVIAALKGVYALLTGFLNTRGYGAVVVAAPATTNGAYAAGDVIGGTNTVQLARANDEAFVLAAAQVVFKAAVTPAIKVVIFDTAPTAIADNNAYSIPAGEAFRIAQTLDSAELGSAYVTHGTPRSVRLVPKDAAVIKPIAGSRNVSFMLVAVDAVTLTSTTDVQVRFTVLGT